MLRCKESQVKSASPCAPPMQSTLLWASQGTSLYGNSTRDLCARPDRKAILLDFFRHAFDGSGADKWGPFTAVVDASK